MSTASPPRPDARAAAVHPAPEEATVPTDRYTKIVKTGSSYLSQSELPLSFGIGTRSGADRVEIEWPSGARQQLDSLAAGVAYEIVEGKGVTRKTPLVGR